MAKCNQLTPRPFKGLRYVTLQSCIEIWPAIFKLQAIFLSKNTGIVSEVKSQDQMPSPRQNLITSRRHRNRRSWHPREISRVTGHRLSTSGLTVTCNTWVNASVYNWHSFTHSFYRSILLCSRLLTWCSIMSCVGKILAWAEVLQLCQSLFSQMLFGIPFLTLSNHPIHLTLSGATWKHTISKLLLIPPSGKPQRLGFTCD